MKKISNLLTSRKISLIFKNKQEMKKLKFLSMAFAAVALASCSSEDLNVASNYKLPGDGTEVLVTVGGNDMRTGFATDLVSDVNGSYSQKAFFTKGDVFKMYCSDVWEPQEYKFKKYAEIESVNNPDAAIFEWADADSPYNKDEVTDLANRQYGMFPADYFHFDNDKREHLLLEIPATIKLGEVKGVKDAVDEKGRNIYTSTIPMFGFCVDDVVKFQYVTSLLRVDMLSLNVNKKHTLKLSSTSYQLSGEFKSEEFDATKGNKGTLPVFGTAKTSEPDDQSISIEFTPKETDVVVYIPLPTGEYDLSTLSLTLQEEGQSLENIENIYVLDKDAEGNRIDIQDYPLGYVLKTGTRLLAVSDKELNATVESLEDLNKIIAKYAAFDRDVVVNVTLGDNVTVGDKTDYIKVPKLNHDMELNIKGGKISGSGQRLIIADSDEVGTGTLTINFDEENPTTIETEDILSMSKQNITLGGKLETETVFQAGSAKVGLAGELSDITVESAGEVNVTAGADVTELTVANVKVNINGAIATPATAAGKVGTLNVTGTKDINVAGEVATLIKVGESSAVTINTTGVATIKKVEGTETKNKEGVYTINAVWDTATTSAYNKKTGTAYDLTEYNDGNIYTAVQLAGLVNASTVSEDVKLYANITITDAKAVWRPLSTVSSFEGDNGVCTIKNVTIEETDNNTSNGSGFFKSKATTVSNLVLDNITINVASGKEVNYIGCLIGKTDDDVAISNVEIKNATINGNDKCNNLGGLIGQASGSGKTVTVSGTTVSAKINGYYNLGGIVGSISECTVILGTKSGSDPAEPVELASATSIVMKKNITQDTDENAGTVGLVTGALLDANAKLQLDYFSTEAAGDPEGWKYDKCRLQIGKVAMTDVWFKGCLDANKKANYFVGYSANAATGDNNYSIGAGSSAKKQKNAKPADDSGEIKNPAAAANTFNVFE